MYELNYNRFMWYVSNYVNCRIRPEGLLYVAQRDPLAIAKFLVVPVMAERMHSRRLKMFKVAGSGTTEHRNRDVSSKSPLYRTRPCTAPSYTLHVQASMFLKARL